MIDMSELANELRTQDNSCDAYPLFVVQQQRRIFGMDPDVDDVKFVWLWSEDYEYEFTDGDVRDEIRRDNAEDERLPGPLGEIDPEEWGYERAAYVDVWDFVTAHLTRRAAQRYIDANAHNLTSPRVYVTSQYRCHEWNSVVDFLKAQVTIAVLNVPRAQTDSSAAVDALDAIAKICGCPEWEYPGQVVRDVELLATSVDVLADAPMSWDELTRAMLDVETVRANTAEAKVVALEGKLSSSLGVLWDEQQSRIREMKERIEDLEKIDISAPPVKSGPHLRALRNWVKWNSSNGDRVTWGSEEEVELKQLSIRELEELAQRIADAATDDTDALRETVGKLNSRNMMQAIQLANQKGGRDE